MNFKSESGAISGAFDLNAGIRKKPSRMKWWASIVPICVALSAASETSHLRHWNTLPGVWTLIHSNYSAVMTKKGSTTWTQLQANVPTMATLLVQQKAMLY